MKRPIPPQIPAPSPYIRPAPTCSTTPPTTTHSQLSREELLDQGIRPNTIRLSIGTEHINDIIADLEQGFAAVR